MKDNKSNVLLTIIAVATLLVAIVGASFAYFSASGGTAKQEIGTGELKISAVSTAVSESNLKPVATANIADVAAKIANSDVAKLPITVDTTGTTITGQYDMYLTTNGIADKIDTAKGNAAHIHWELVKGEAGAETTVNTGTFAAGDANKLKINDVPVSITAGGAVEQYKLLIYILDTPDASQDDLQGMTITAYTTVEAKQNPNSLQ